MFELPETAQQWVNDVLVWIGFGTLAGLAAKAVMPGRDPGGSLATIIMGILGSVIGSALLMFAFDVPRVTPVSPLGFLVATAGAIVLLFIYRLMSGRIFREDGTGGPRMYRWSRNRRRTPAVYD